MDCVELTKKLISLPSFVTETEGEAAVGSFIKEYFEQRFPEFKIFTTEISPGRFNLLVYNDPKPSLIFVGHMDTVPPAGDITERLNPRLESGRLYGLGAVDMKGGMACSIAALEGVKKLPAMAYLFDCGEEYYFEGITRFIADYKAGLTPLNNMAKPELVIFPEPSDLKIGSACRGCVELEVGFSGKTAHSGNPGAGRNAIELGMKTLSELRSWLEEPQSDELGRTTLNVSGVTGGVLQNGLVSVRANAISDYAEFTLDIRTAVKEQTAKAIIAKLQALALSNQIKVLKVEVKLDLCPFVADRSDLVTLEKAIVNGELPVAYKDNVAASGYGEFAMVGASLGWNAVNFGPGPGSMSHQSEEFVEIESLKKTTAIYQELFKLLGSK